jgi:hypothetical protein
MTVVILITSNGLVLASHTCLKKSDTTVSLFKSKSCCGKTKKSCESSEQNSLKSNCCVSSVSYHKVSVNSLPLVKQVIEMHLFTALVADFLTTPVSVAASASVIAKPPLLHSGGSDLLIQISTFRI